MDAETLVLIDPEAYLVVNLDGHEEYEVGLTFKDLTAPPANGKNDLVTYVYRVVQQDAQKGTVIGGITYHIEVPAR